MNAHRMTVGDWIAFEDERHQVAGLDGLTVRLRSETGRLQVILLSEVLTDTTFQASVAPPDTADSPDGADDLAALDPGGILASIDKELVKDAVTKEADLLEAMTGYRSGDPLDALPGEPRPEYAPDLPLTERVASKARERGVSERWIWKQWAQRQEHGLWGLVDKRRAKLSNPLKNVPAEVLQAIRDQAEAERLDSTATIGNRFLRRTQQRLDAQHGEGAFTLPERDAFRRIVKNLLGGRVTEPAYRRATAANQPDRTFGNVIAHRPGEVVMLDTTPLDVLAFDPETAKTHRVELTIAIDVATRSILAWRLTPEGTKAIDIGLLLADVMTPEPMRPAWAEALRYQVLRIPYDRKLTIDERLAEAAARPVVYPETLLYDHGKPYKSDVVQRACYRWRIDLQDARKLKPTDKPHVERLFGTIRQQFSEHVAGYKGNNVANRGRTAEDQARWTIDELAEFFAEYVVAVYQRRTHRGLHLPGFPDIRVSPNEAYRQALGSAGYVDCPRDPNLYYELLPIERRVIHPYGVEIDHLVYNGDVLYGYRGSKSDYPDGLWPIRSDPRNLLHAYFLDPATGKWYVLTWTHATGEHQPFTDITLREAKRYIAARGKTPDDQDAIAEALVALQNRMDAPETWTADRKRKIRDRHRAAAQAADMQRADPPANSPTLHVISDAEPDGEPEGEEGAFWGDLDLTTIKPAEIWAPSTRQDR
ncbi:transposase [Kitasatospora sp. NPDC094015]|uniref:transposase n=1 Tax=Kitasatospora sp. NPDC094015 TaxID=3155205 RepID=UPI00331ED8BC